MSSLPFSSTFIVALVCIAEHSHSLMLDLKMFATKVLVGCAFAKSFIMALSVGLICSVGVEDILVVFSCTCRIHYCRRTLITNLNNANKTKESHFTI